MKMIMKLILRLSIFSWIFLIVMNFSALSQRISITPSGASGVNLSGEPAFFQIQVKNNSSGASTGKLGVKCVSDEGGIKKYTDDIKIAAQSAYNTKIDIGNYVGYWQIEVVMEFENGTKDSAFSGLTILNKPATYKVHDKNSFFGIMLIKDFEAADRMGCKFNRLPAIWEYIEKNEGQYDWTMLDRSVKEAESHGIGVVLTVVPKNSAGTTRIKWAKWKDDEDLANDVNIKYFANFVKAVVLRYKDKVVAFELLNEPDQAFFEKGKNLSARRAALITWKLQTTGYKLVKQFAPNVPIIGLSESGVDFRKGLPFFNEVMRNGNKDVFDILGAHAYSPGKFVDEDNPPKYPDDYKLRQVIMQGLSKMKSMGMVPKFWGTELGWAYKVGTLPLSKEGLEIAAVTTQALVTVKSVPGAEKLFWFVFSFNTNAGPGKMYNYSLINMQSGASFPYSSASAYATTAYFLNDAIFKQNKKLANGAEIYTYQNTKGQAIAIIWSNKLQMKVDVSNLSSAKVYNNFGRQISINNITIGSSPYFFVMPDANIQPLIDELK